jgi:hypothetical protein
MRQLRRSLRIATVAVGAVVGLAFAGCSDSNEESAPEREAQSSSTTSAAPATSPTTTKQAVARQRYAQELMQIRQERLDGNVTSDDLEAAAEQMNFMTLPVGMLGGHQDLRQALLKAAALSGSAQKAAVKSLRTDFRRLATKADPGSA